MELNLRGRTALVTGASKGIGRASAEALASEGVNVILVSRTLADLKAARQKIIDRWNVDVQVRRTATGNLRGGIRTSPIPTSRSGPGGGRPAGATPADAGERAAPVAAASAGRRPLVNYLLAERTSFTSLAAARHIGPPGASYSAWTIFRYSAIAASCLSGVATSSVLARMMAVLALAACARSTQRPTSFQFLSKKTTTGIDW